MNPEYAGRLNLNRSQSDEKIGLVWFVFGFYGSISLPPLDKLNVPAWTKGVLTKCSQPQ
ncbi:MAG TPA: hypothetical protein VMH87_18365 [Pseudomonadales bacterium]|nr:hypothetical protein [Pseudomonadales bacterium]